MQLMEQGIGMLLRRTSDIREGLCVWMFVVGGWLVKEEVRSFKEAGPTSHDPVCMGGVMFHKAEHSSTSLIHCFHGFADLISWVPLAESLCSRSSLCLNSMLRRRLAPLR